MAFNIRDAEYYFQNSILASSLNASLKQRKSVLEGSIVWTFRKNFSSEEAVHEFKSERFRLPCLDDCKFQLTAELQPNHPLTVSLHANCDSSSFRPEDKRHIHVAIHSVKSRNPHHMIHFNPSSNKVSFKFEDERNDGRVTFIAICKIRLQEFQCFDGSEDQELFHLAQDLSEDLQTLQHCTAFSDLLISSRSEIYTAHKFILEGRSFVLKWMISASRQDHITVDDVPNPLNFLFYIYSGGVLSVHLTNMLDLYENANRYFLYQLREYCSKFLFMKLNMTVVVRVYKLSKLFLDHRLKARAMKYMLDNLHKLKCRECGHYIVESRALFAELPGIYPRLQLPYLGQGGQNSANEGWPYEQENRNAESLGHRSGLHERQLHGPEERYENANWIFCHQDHGLEIHINDEQEVEHEGSESEEEL